MKRITITAFAVMMVMGLAGISHGAGNWEDEEITISPKLLVLDYSGTRITVHTNIQASEVVMSSVYIEVNGSAAVQPCAVFSDLCGNLVAKFMVEDLRALVEPPSADITLHGAYKDGGEFFAEGSIGIK